VNEILLAVRETGREYRPDTVRTEGEGKCGRARGEGVCLVRASAPACRREGRAHLLLFVDHGENGLPVKLKCRTVHDARRHDVDPREEVRRLPRRQLATSPNMSIPAARIGAMPRA
jgi:hypothetical protein